MEKTTRAPNGNPQPRRYSSAAKSPTITHRVRGGLYEKLKYRAEQGEVSLSEEIERRLIRSFEMEEQIKTMQAVDLLLWPDAEARALGRAFAMTLDAARRAVGPDWREDPSIPLVIAGVMRRLLDRCVRDGETLAAALAVDPIRAAATADSIAETVGSYLDTAMPPLPEPAFDVMEWTGRVYLETEFRDAASGEVLETVTGPECDVADPERRPMRGEGYRAALARFAPIRETVEAEDFQVYVMKDGAAKRVSLDLTPAGPGPQAEQPAALMGMSAAGADAPDWRPAPGILPPGIGDRALLDETLRDPRPDEPQAAPEPAPAPKRRGRPKVTA